MNDQRRKLAFALKVRLGSLLKDARAIYEEEAAAFDAIPEPLQTDLGYYTTYEMGLVVENLEAAIRSLEEVTYQPEPT